MASFSSRPTKSPKQRAETCPSPTPSLPLRRIDNIRYGCTDRPRPNLGLPDRVTRARLGSTPGLLACIPESSLSLFLNCSVSCLQMMCPINQKTPTRLWWPPHLGTVEQAPPRILPALVLTMHAVSSFVVSRSSPPHARLWAVGLVQTILSWACRGIWRIIRSVDVSLSTNYCLPSDPSLQMFLAKHVPFPFLGIWYCSLVLAGMRATAGMPPQHRRTRHVP